MGDGLHVGRAIALLHEEALVVLEAVGRPRHRVVEAVGVVVLHGLAGALLQVGGGDQLEVGLQGQAHRPALALRALHRELEDVEAVALQDGGQGDLALPPVPVLGDEAAHGRRLPGVAARAREHGGDVLEDGLHPERLRDEAAQAESVRRGVALGHEEGEHLVPAEGAHREGGHHRAVDAAREADHHPPALQRPEDLLAERRLDPRGDGGRVDPEHVPGEHGAARESFHRRWTPGRLVELDPAPPEGSRQIRFIAPAVCARSTSARP